MTNRRGFVPVLNRPAARRGGGGLLGTPSNVTTYPAASAIGVTWTAVPQAINYELERSLDGSTGWSVIASPAVTYYSDVLMVPGSVYWYRVRASIPSGFSGYSAATRGAATGSGAGFPALILWAEDAWSATSGGTLVTADNADILRLRDRSGNGRDFTAVTAGQKATLQTNELNGKPIIRADAVTAHTFFQTTRFTVNDFHLAMLAKPLYPVTTQLLAGDDITTNRYLANYTNLKNFSFYDGTAATTNDANQFVNTGYAVNSSNRNMGVSGTTPTWRAYKNGINQGSPASVVSGGPTGFARLFNRQNGNAGEWWGGDIAYLHLWPSDAPNAAPLALAQVGQWGVAYYGIPLACLPVPANFAATVTGPTEVTLTWDHVSGAVSYRVYQAYAPCYQSQLPIDFSLCGTVNAGLESGSPVTCVVEELITGIRVWFIVQPFDANGIAGLPTLEATAVPTALPATLLGGYNCDLSAMSVTSDAAGATPATTNGAVVQRFNEGAALGNAVSTGGATGQATLKVYPDGRRAVIANGTSTQFDVAGARSYTDFHLYLVGASLDENVSANTLRVLLGDKVASRFLLRVKANEAQFYDGTAAYNANNAVQIRLRGLIEIQRSGTSLRVWANHKQQGPTLTVPATGVTFDALFALNGANFSSFEFYRLVIYPTVHTLAQRAQQWAYFEAQYQFLDGADSYNRIPQTTHLGFCGISNAILCSNGDRIVCHQDAATTEGATGRVWWMRSKSGGKGWNPVYHFKRSTTVCQYPGPMLLLPPTHLLYPNRVVGTIYDGPPTRTIYAIHSDASGEPGTWITGALLPPPAGYTWWVPYQTKQLAPDGQTILQGAYGLKTSTGFTDNFLMQSTDGGDTYQFLALISAGTASRQPNETALVQTTGSNQLAVWRRDTSGGNFEFATSTDNGMTWSASANFAPSSAGGETLISPCFVKLTVGPSAGHIWLFIGLRPNGIAAIRSTDNGANWSARRYVHRAGTLGNNGYPEAYQRPDGLVELIWFHSLNPAATPNDKTENWRTVMDPASFWS